MTKSKESKDKNKNKKRSVGSLLRKSYVRKPKTKLDKVMAGIALYDHLNSEYPPAEEIIEAFEHEKLEPKESLNNVLLKEFPGIELPIEFQNLKED